MDANNARPRDDEQHNRMMVVSMGVCVGLLMVCSLAVLVSTPLVRYIAATGILLGGIGTGAFAASLYTRGGSDAE